MPFPTLVELLEAGVHFGHEKSKWNPNMEPYIFTTRNKVHVLNLHKTLSYLKKACNFVQKLAAQNKTILFVGTKRQARAIVKEQAERAGMPYVTTRWLGGTLTNFETILKSITKLDELKKQLSSSDAGQLTKKEKAVIENEIKRLEQVLEGVKNMRKMPDAVFLIGAHNEKTALKEAKRKGVSVIALTDTNADPAKIDYPIPANDDALRSINVIVKVVTDAILKGKAGQSAEGKDKNDTVDQDSIDKTVGENSKEDTGTNEEGEVK